MYPNQNRRSDQQFSWRETDPSIGFRMPAQQKPFHQFSERANRNYQQRNWPGPNNAPCPQINERQQSYNDYNAPQGNLEGRGGPSNFQMRAPSFPRYPVDSPSFPRYPVDMPSFPRYPVDLPSIPRYPKEARSFQRYPVEKGERSDLSHFHICQQSGASHRHPDGQFSSEFLEPEYNATDNQTEPFSHHPPMPSGSSQPNNRFQQEQGPSFQQISFPLKAFPVHRPGLPPPQPTVHSSHLQKDQDGNFHQFSQQNSSQHQENIQKTDQNQSNNLSKSIASPVDHTKTEMSETQQHLQRWLEKSGVTCKRRETHLRTSGNFVAGVTVPVYKGMLQEYFQLLQLFKRQKLVLSLHKAMNEKSWQAELAKVVATKKRLTELQSKLANEDIKTLKSKLEQIKRKRGWKKRKRLREYERKVQKENRWQELHERLDEKIAKAEQQKIQEKQDEEMQKAIDSALQEVRAKKKDITNTQAMLRACRKLRNVRREMTIQKGGTILAEDDSSFELGIKSLEELLDGRLKEYRDEERTLQVMVEGEQEEIKAKEREKKEQKEAEKLKRMRQDLKEFLFGKDEDDVFSMGLMMYKDFFTQSEKELQTLIDIRRQWDSYLVPEDDPEGSAVPLQWVVPSEASSEEWAAAIINR